MSDNKDHVMHYFMDKSYPTIVRGEGIYLYDDSGNRFIDANSGAILASLGHGQTEIAQTLKDQAEKLAYLFRMDFTTPPLDEAAAKVCDVSKGEMEKIFFVSGGSEANEIAVKIARKYQIDTGNPGKYKVISRWLSYHGATNATLSLSGMPARRADYTPFLQEFGHIPPPYCYRCWYGLTPENCSRECALALENEILLQGPETVSAFIAEPISGMGLCGSIPPDDYFKIIREICDRYDVLLIFDEVMTGYGRTGKWFAFEHFGVIPDLVSMGKALGGGYFPIGAVGVTDRVAETIAQNSGLFTTGFSWAGNPLGAAVVAKVTEYLIEHKLVDHCAQVGDYLGEKLEKLRSHPSVGDVRGIGLLWGLEFVKDKKDKTCFDPQIRFGSIVAAESMKLGLCTMASGNCDKGHAGDMLMIGPAFIVTEGEIDEIVGLLDQALTRSEEMVGL